MEIGRLILRPYRKILTFRSRSGRIEFFLFIILQYIFVLLNFLLASIFDYGISLFTEDKSIYFIIENVIVIFLLIYFVFVFPLALVSLCVRRFLDMGLFATSSLSWIILPLLPVLMFWPPERSVNIFGPPGGDY